MPRPRGTTKLHLWLDTGEALKPRDAIQAKCSECMNEYADGVIDCEIVTCALYPYQPRSSKPYKRKARKPKVEAF